MTSGDILFHATTKTQPKTDSAGVDIWYHFDMLPVVEKCKITTAHDNLRTSQESGGILRREGKWISWEQYLSGENVGIMVTAHSGTVQRVR